MLYVHRIDANVGDRKSCPAEYFPLPPGPRLDIQAVRAGDVKGHDLVVLGGGGLFHFERDLRRLLDCGVGVVGWGIGTNTHGRTDAHYPVDPSEFALLGLRDAGPGWVPCASCMSSLFGDPPRPTREVVAYEHHQQPTGLPFPKLKNDASTLTEVVRFLGSAEVVVTNTYHGWYWSTLLGKKVVLFRPFSSRFHHLPWPCPVARAADDLPGAVKESRAYPEALLEARLANLRFYDSVTRMLRGHAPPTSATPVGPPAEG